MFRKIISIVVTLLFIATISNAQVPSGNIPGVGGNSSSSSGGGLGGVTNFGSQSTGTQTCPISSTTCTVTLTGASVTLDAASPATPSAILVWQITQDATGGRIPTWSSAFQFDAESAGGIFNTPIVPILSASKSESITFAWNGIVSKWVLVGRSGAQMLAGSNQGGASAIGGPSNSTDLVTNLPANVWTSTMADNGGFFTPEGGGVAFYSYMVSGEITICNPNRTTEFFSQYCQFTLTAQRVNSDNEIDGNACVTYPINFANGNISGPNTFGNFTCFINPTANLKLVNHSYYTEEVPLL